MCLQIFCCVIQHTEQQNQHSCCQYLSWDMHQENAHYNGCHKTMDNGHVAKKNFLRAWFNSVPMLSVVSSEAQFPQAFHISAGLPSGLSHRHWLRGILPDHWGFVWKQSSLKKQTKIDFIVFFSTTSFLVFLPSKYWSAIHIPAMASCFCYFIFFFTTNIAGVMHSRGRGMDKGRGRHLSVTLLSQSHLVICPLLAAVLFQHSLCSCS